MEKAGIPEARRFIVDFAAAGLLKAYAETIVTTEACGTTTTVRGATIPTHLWKRIVVEDVADNVWVGGSVRLAGSGLRGGTPEVWITGIGFSESFVRRVVARHTGVAPVPSKPIPRSSQPVAPVADEPAMPPAPLGRQPDPTAIPEGALLATIRQTQAALGLGRTKVNELMNSGRLVRREIDGGVRIEVSSIRALAGGGVDPDRRSG